MKPDFNKDLLFTINIYLFKIKGEKSFEIKKNYIGVKEKIKRKIKGPTLGSLWLARATKL